MFTVEQIKAAHSKVNTGTDFPNYIQEIKQMGVTAFKTWVADSHTEYYGEDDYRTESQPMYDDLVIAGTSNAKQFLYYLGIHQKGETDYLTFCRHCAETGIAYWFVSLVDMNCIYYDKAGNTILEEQIPG